MRSTGYCKYEQVLRDQFRYITSLVLHMIVSSVHIWSALVSVRHPRDREGEAQSLAGTNILMW
jgi:hypothetical protein